MGTTLTGTRISDTYDSLLKATDNGIITSSAKQITDGVGNNTPLYISTSRIGIGVSPTTAFQVSGNSKIGGDLTVTGNLLVEGTTTTVDTDTLSVKDPLIIVGNDNNTSDLVDLGFYGLYDTSGSQDLYAGLYRSASTTKFHLFKDLQEEPTTTVNTSGTGYTKADLVIGDLEAERGTFTDSIFVSPSLYVSDAILHTGDIDTKLEFLSDQIKFSTGGSFRLSINNSYSEFFTNVRFEDGIKAQFGDNQDLEIYYDGTTDRAYFNSTSANQSIFAGGAESFIRVGGTQNALVANHNGNVSLNYSGATKLSTSSTGVTVEGIVASDGLDLGDNDKVRLGDSQDLEIYHNGTHSYIDNNTGDIIIRNDAADKGISFLADDGAGGSENYVYIDGGAFQTKFYKDTKHLDSVKAFFGTGSDLQIWSTGSNDYISSNFNSLAISSFADNKSVEINTTQAGGSLALIIKAAGTTGEAQLYHLGVLKLKTSSTGVTVTGRISGLTDPSAAQDAATKSYVDTQIGANNELSEVLANGNTTGGTDIAVSANDDITFTDTSKAYFGTGNDLEIYHNGSHAYLTNDTGNFEITTTGNLILQNASSNKWMMTNQGGGVLLYYNGGTSKLTTTPTGISINGRISGLTDPTLAQDAATKAYVDLQVGNNNELSEVLANGNTTGGTDIAVGAGDDITFTDTSKALFGAGGDLQIYHDGSDSYVRDTGTGFLYIDTDSVIRMISDGSYANGKMATFDKNGPVELYYNNLKRFGTTSAGVTFSNLSNTSAASSSVDEVKIGTFGAGRPAIYFGSSNTTYTNSTWFIENVGAAGKLRIGRNGLDVVEIFNDGNTTFAGEVKLQSSNAFTTLRTGNDYGWSIYANSSNFLTFGSGATANTKATSWLTIQDNNGNATFAGDVKIAEASNKGQLFFGTANTDYEIKGGGNYGYISLNAPILRFDTGGTERMRIDSSGIVKINTTAVNARFRVDEGRTSEWVAGFKHTGATPYGVFIDTSGNTSTGYTLGCYTNTGTGLFLKNDGNVGIGTTSPTSYYSGADNLVVKQDSGEGGMSIVTANDTTGAIYFADGTSGNEQYRGGIGYTHSTDKLFLVSGGQTRVWMNDSGNVGIGTDSPDAKLQVQGTNSGVLIDTSTAYTPLIKASGALSDLKLSSVGNGGNLVLEADCTTASIIQFNNGGSERMRITSGGLIQASAGGGGFRVVSDAANPSNLIEYYYSSSFNHGLEVEGDRGLKMYSNTGDNSGKLTFYTEGSEKMRITSGGVIQNNSLTTTQSSAVRFSNDGFTWGMIIEDDQVNNGLILFSAQNGDSVGSITRSGLSTSFNTVSDYRLKEDLQDFAGLDMVSKIPVYDFKWKSEESRSYGVMAHELQEVLPDAVTGKKDAKEMQGVDYSKIVPLLVKSIQELKAEIELLKTQINN